MKKKPDLMEARSVPDLQAGEQAMLQNQKFNNMITWDQYLRTVLVLRQTMDCSEAELFEDAWAFLSRAWERYELCADPDFVEGPDSGPVKKSPPRGS